MTVDFSMYALHRVNTATGVVERFSRGTFPAGPKETIEGIAASADKGLMEPGWEIRAMRDVRAELELEGVPELIISVVEPLAHGYNWGLCDPMYMSNRVAAKFGWGDGMSNFSAMETLPHELVVREFAREIRESYRTVFDELGVSEVEIFERISLPLQEEAARRRQFMIPRG